MTNRNYYEALSFVLANSASEYSETWILHFWRDRSRKWEFM